MIKGGVYLLAIVLIMILTIYMAMIFSVRYRTAISVMGIAVLLIYGTISATFPATEAFKTFPLEIVVLVLALALFSKIFENNGFFKYIGDKFLKLSKGRKTFIAILIPFVMYATSLFMNNLSVVLLFTFICIELAIALKLPIVPLLVSGLIASNIGGCPLPWADTPAVILTLYSDFALVDFLTKLFLPCLICIILLILYTLLFIKRENKILEKAHNKHTSKDKPLKKTHNNFLKHLNDGPPPPPHEDITTEVNGELITIPPPPPPPPPFMGLKHLSNCPKWRKIVLPIIMFIFFIFFICIAPFFNISIAYISMFFIGTMLFITIEKPEDIINSLPVLDSLVFISALFMIAGVLENSGILGEIVVYFISFTGDSKILILLCIMISAFIIATFLSAGPAAATILPICLQLSPIVGDKLVYAALALGILAGSSMLPWSATGGPIMLSEVGRFLHHNKVSPEDAIEINEIYNFKHYILFSIPFSLIILLVSALFLTIYLLI